LNILNIIIPVGIIWTIGSFWSISSLWNGACEDEEDFKKDLKHMDKQNWIVRIFVQFIMIIIVFFCLILGPIPLMVFSLIGEETEN